jgi:LMBR1 domain-containing protein 1
MLVVIYFFPTISSAAESRAERLAATAKGCCFCIQRCLRPFGILFGIIFLLISLALVASVILGAVDRVLHSYCGAGCGFILKLPMIWNPIDMFLVILSRVFPLDFVMVALLVVYFYFATLKGLTRAGIRFLWIQLYAFKKRHTLPQGLLIGGGIMMFCVLALNMQLVSLAPRYAYWGSQTWIPPATNVC